MGNRAPGPGNAIARARKQNFDRLWTDYPHAALKASGPSVGLPDGQMGNSEVGHLTLGAGAVVPQTLTLIDNAVADGALAHNPVLRDALRASERVHLVGMVSDGGVHSGFGHLHALVELAAELRVRDLVLHCFTDGRDTSPTSGEGYLATLGTRCRRVGVGRVATVVGRYWAMDATGAGSASRTPMTCSCTDAPSTTRPTGRRRRAPPTSAARPTSSSGRPRSGRRAGASRRQRAVLQLPPRPDAGDRARVSPNPTLAMAPRISPAGVDAAAAGRSAAWRR